MNIENYEKIPVGQAKDLTNKRFGILTVLFRTKNVGKVTRWVCQCDCGTIKDYNAQHLTSGAITSCGCQNRKKASQRMKEYNLNHQTLQIGDKYGLLTIIDYLGLRKQSSRNRNEAWYLCQCDCGSKPIEVRGNDLRTGSKNSCGCMCSSGETQIKKILEENNIFYKKEVIYPDLKNPNTNCHLRFDFGILQDNIIKYLIEFDGRQHFTGPEAKWTHSCSLEDIQFRDQLKNNYCKINNIPLIRIPYTQLYKITLEDLIPETSKFLC